MRHIDIAFSLKYWDLCWRSHREKIREKHIGCQYSSILCFRMYPNKLGISVQSGSLQWTNLKQILFKSNLCAGVWHQVRQDLNESLLWRYACITAKVPVWGPGLEPHFAPSCARFWLLYCLLSWRSSLQESFMQNVKLSVCPTSAGCICSNREKFAQQASETGSVSSSSVREEAEHCVSTQESSYTCPLHCQAANGWLFAVVTRY